jgi:hypothetical protein
VKCVAGACPVAKGECDQEGECYLWRCENPQAPKPTDDLLAEFAELVLMANAARSVA